MIRFFSSNPKSADEKVLDKFLAEKGRFWKRVIIPGYDYKYMVADSDGSAAEYYVSVAEAMEEEESYH